MSCHGHLQENAAKRETCNGDNPNCILRAHYDSCEYCPLYTPIIVKVTVPSNSTLEKRKGAAGGKDH